MTDCMNLGTHIVTSSFKPASLNPKTASCTLLPLLDAISQSNVLFQCTLCYRQAPGSCTEWQFLWNDKHSSENLATWHVSTAWLNDMNACTDKMPCYVLPSRAGMSPIFMDLQTRLPWARRHFWTRESNTISESKITNSLAATVCLLLHEWGSCQSKQFAIK